MVGRPNKYIRGIVTSVYTDEIDISFLDDHRGKLSRSEYLIEAMYAMHGDQRIKAAFELVKEKDKEIYELKRELMFERTKNKRARPSIKQNEEKLTQFYTDKNLTEVIKKYGSNINWASLFDRNIERLTGVVKDSKQLEAWAMEHFSNNGGKHA